MLPAAGEEPGQNDVHRRGVSERSRREAAALSAEVRALAFEKNRSRRYDACSDVAVPNTFEPTSQG